MTNEIVRDISTNESEKSVDFNAWPFINIGKRFACTLLDREHAYIVEALNFTRSMMMSILPLIVTDTAYLRMFTLV